jgi:CPA2 family monovalent cation:H+ antiporter-2
MLPPEGQSLILAGAIISISLNPFIFGLIEPAQRWMRANPNIARILERTRDPLAELPASVEPAHVTGHVVLVGYGRVGRSLAAALQSQGIPYVVAEQNREIVNRLRSEGQKAVAGDASDPAVLVQAHVARAGILVIALPDTFHVRKMAETARALNPGIETIVRSHGEEESDLLRKENIGKVFMGEHELALSMARYVMERIKKD